MKNRRIVSLIMILALIAALAACGQSNDDAGSSGNAAGTEAPQTQTPAETKAPDTGNEVIALSYWYSMDGAGGECFVKQMERFNDTIGAEKGIHVTGVYQDWPGTNALTAAMATDDVDNMPDVIHMFSEYVNLISGWERSAWAEDFITAPGSSVTKEDLISNTVSAYSIDGKMIGVPYAISALLLYYNVDQLSEAGYDAPPETIAEMAEMISAIREKTGADYGLNVRLDQFEFENFIAIQGANGTYFGNNESGRSGTMTELTCQDEISKFLDEWQKVIDSGAYKETKDSMNEEFAQGLNSMCIMSSARIPAIAALVGDSFEWGVAAIPKVSAEDVGGAYPSGSGLFMIDRGDQERLDAAWAFVQYLISAEAQAMWLDGTGYVPVNINAVDTDAYKEGIEKEPRLNLPFEILSHTPSTVVASFCPNAEEVNNVIKTAMLEFAGGATKDETYTAIIDGIASAFADYFRAHPIDQ